MSFAFWGVIAQRLPSTFVTGPSRLEVAARIDHTLLRPEATAADVITLCQEARLLRVAAVCVSASMVAVAAHALAGSGVAVAAVVGFPSGAHRSAVKAAEASSAIDDGATELDMVIDLGAAAVGRWDLVTIDVAAVRAAAPRPVVLKVILESGLRTASELDAACAAAVSAGADLVKTSTGFHPAGVATPAAVAAMARAVGPGVGVKASGGITSAGQALALLAAGATRLGMSRTAAVLAELDDLPETDGPTVGRGV
jgi:deoxyribose-phosphate aldolase